jgi:hypothetical protein
MEKYSVTARDISPEIQLDPVSGYMHLTGTSIPENSEEVYRPVLNWLKAYAAKPANKTNMDVRLDYFNTSSSKFLMEILRLLKQIKESGHPVGIRWFYYEDDPDMLEAGQDFMDIVGMDMEMVILEEKV